MFLDQIHPIIHKQMTVNKITPPLASLYFAHIAQIPRVLGEDFYDMMSLPCLSCSDKHRQTSALRAIGQLPRSRPSKVVMRPVIHVSIKAQRKDLPDIHRKRQESPVVLQGNFIWNSLL